MHAELCPPALPSKGDRVVADITHRDCFFINIPPLGRDFPVGPPEPPERVQPEAWLRAESVSAEIALDLQVLATVERLTVFASASLRQSLQETVRGLTKGLRLPATVKIHF